MRRVARACRDAALSRMAQRARRRRLGDRRRSLARSGRRPPGSAEAARFLASRDPRLRNLKRVLSSHVPPRMRGLAPVASTSTNETVMKTISQSIPGRRLQPLARAAQIALMAVPFASAAQTSPSTTTTLPPVTVTGTNTAPLTQVTEDIAASPASVTVLGRKELDQKTITTYGDIFRGVPGVFVNEFGQGLIAYETQVPRLCRRPRVATLASISTACRSTSPAHSTPTATPTSRSSSPSSSTGSRSCAAPSASMPATTPLPDRRSSTPIATCHRPVKVHRGQLRPGARAAHLLDSRRGRERCFWPSTRPRAPPTRSKATSSG